MRLFAAAYPPDAVLDHAEVALDVFRHAAPVHPARRTPDLADSARWVPRESLHLTTAFYADVPEGAIPELEAALADVARAAAPFDLRLRGAGTFQGRVLWLGVDDATGALAGLARACLDAGVREVPDDVHPHRPHLTVARARPAAGRRSRRSPQVSVLDAPARALAVYAGPSWTVHELTLVESRLGEGSQGGPSYRELARWPLGDVSGQAH